MSEWFLDPCGAIVFTDLCMSVTLMLMIFFGRQLKLTDRALTIWIWPGCLRGQLTVTAPTHSLQLQIVKRNPKE